MKRNNRKSVELYEEELHELLPHLSAKLKKSAFLLSTCVLIVFLYVVFFVQIPITSEVFQDRKMIQCTNYTTLYELLVKGKSPGEL